MIDAALFNHLIDNARQLATVSHALVAKSVLSQLILWRRRVNLVHLNHKCVVVSSHPEERMEESHHPALSQGNWATSGRP